MWKTARLAPAVLFIAPPALAAVLVAAAPVAVAQSTGCWRSTDCRAAPAPAAPSGDFRYGSGTAPETDFRSPSGGPVGAGPYRLDGEPVADAERRLQRPENMRWRQYTAPTWPQPMAGSGDAPGSTATGYGQ
jgi:hypothetical protein